VKGLFAIFGRADETTEIKVLFPAIGRPIIPPSARSFSSN